MLGRGLDIIFILIVLYLVVMNATNFSKVIEAIAGGTARLVQVLQGNVAAGQGT